MPFSENTPMLLTKDACLKVTALFCNMAISDEIYNPNFNLSKLHLHEFVEFSFVLEGSGYHRIWNDVVECKKGDVYIINTGVPHGYFAKSKDEMPTICNILIDPQRLFEGEVGQMESPRFCYGIFKQNPFVAFKHLKSDEYKKIKSLYQNVWNEIIHKQEEWEPLATAYLKELLITMMRYMTVEQMNYSNLQSEKSNLITSAMRLVMENCFDQGFNLKSVAKTLFISEAHLSRVFYQMSGQYFSDCVRNIRLKKACQLLENTDLTNEEIVAECGLKDVPSFYRLFKQQMSLTPNQYRKKFKGSTEQDFVQEIAFSMKDGDPERTKDFVKRAMEQGVPAQDILNDGLIKGMNLVGEKFKNGEIYIPEVLVASKIINACVQLIKPLLPEAETKNNGKVVIGTVKGDIHDIGKNLVKMMMEAKGLEVIDLGTNVSAENFIQTAINENCQVVCCSALLTTTMGVMTDVVKYAIEQNVRHKIKILVGGAPVTEVFRNSINADAYADNAMTAAELAFELCKT